MDSDTAPIDDLALPLDPESAYNDDPGAILVNDEPALDQNIESPAHNLNAPSGIEEPVRCVNCGIDIMHRRSRTLERVEILSVIRQWTAPQLVSYCFTYFIF